MPKQPTENDIQRAQEIANEIVRDALPESRNETQVRTYKSIGDVVREHAAADTWGTDSGIEFLELGRLTPRYRGLVNGAANLYLSALSIIRQQQEEIAKLRANPSERGDKA